MPIAPNITSELIVRIRNLAFGGDGVGEVTDGDRELLGITAFVPYTVPGEIVRARASEHKARYIKASSLQVIEPSPDRVVPECPYFETCGGCELQHIRYETQLQLKLEMVRGQLAAARFGVDILNRLQPVVPSQPFGYRRRISLHIDERGAVGFYRTNSRSVVPIDDCPIAVPAIQERLKNVQEFGAVVRGRVSSLLLEADAEGVIAVMKTPYDLGRVEQEQLLQSARKHFDNVVLISAKGEIGGFGRQILELPLQENNTFTLRVPAGYFSQVNGEINAALIADVLGETRGVAGHESVTVCDLYAGAGNFSLPLARAGHRVVAVECDARLAALAKQNIQRYQLQRNLQFIESSVEKFLVSPRGKDRFDVVVADPPRSGFGSIPISAIPPTGRLIFISCHLPSFVRDLKNLIEAGYELQRITPYDMFAQTSYLEIVSVFEKR